MKKLISVILAVVLAISMLSVTAFADVMAGDTNKDGNITATDARMILRVVAGLDSTSEAFLYDVNADGKVSASDARIILRIVAGLQEHPDSESKAPLTKEEQLDYFVKSFNGVKTNAKSVTNVGNKAYNYNNYVYVHPVLEGLYNATANPGDPSMKEQLTEGFSDEFNIENKTYEGDAISTVFPPIGGECKLTMNDVSNISFVESGEYYVVEVTVKGKKNPSRYESVGNVASIVTKADMEAEMSPEDLEMMSIDCDYKNAVAKAKIEKATGNMVEYNVDYPMIMIMNMTGLGEVTKIGMGLYEEWTIAY